MECLFFVFKNYIQFLLDLQKGYIQINPLFVVVQLLSHI